MSHVPAPTVRPEARGRVEVARLVAAAVALLVLVLVLGSVAPAAAAEGDDGASEVEALGLVATLGYDGHGLESRPAPLTVRLHPQRPVQGRLVVSSTREGGGASLVQQLDVEVGAGVEKRFHLLVPRTAGGVEVALAEDGAEAAAEVRAVRRPHRGFLVAALGFDATELPATTLPQTGAPLVPVTLPLPVLDLGPSALAPLSVVVVRQSELVELDAPQRRTLAAAVADGLQLVVTESDDPDLGLPWRPATAVRPEGLEPAPAAWATSTVALAAREAEADEADDEAEEAADTEEVTDATPQLAAVRAGRGRVVVTTLALGDPALEPAWPHVLQPSRIGGLGPTGLATMDVAASVPELFRSTTGGAPGVGWIAAFLVAYLVVVGPVVGVVLRRRRRPELAWVVVPVVTALFAGAAFVGAVGSRPSIGVLGQAEVWVDGIGTEVVAGVVRAPTTGTHAIGVDGAGWSMEGAGWNAHTTVAEGEGRADAHVRLVAQSAGGVLATRVAEAEAPLQVEAAIVDGELQVEVANTSEHDLRRVRVEVAALARTITDGLPAGETVIETLELPDVLPGLDQPFEDPRWRMLEGGHARDTAALQVLLGDRLDTTRPGVIWVTAEGDTSPAASAVTIDGTTPVDTGRFLAVGVTPTTTDGATHPAEVLGDVVVPVDAPVWRDGATVVSGETDLPVRVRLPREGDPTQLEVEAVDAVLGDPRGRPAFPMDPAFECPPDAVSCEFDESGGQVCFPDGTCEGFEVNPAPPPDGPVGQPEDPPDLREPGSPIELWDHGTGAWVPVAEDEITSTSEVDRWVGPLGDVWLRTVGDFVQLDLARLSVGARSGGST